MPENNDTSMLVYPNNLQEHNVWTKLTSYSYNLRLYGSSFSRFFSQEQSENFTNDITSDITSQLFLPIPNSGLGTKDSLDYNQHQGGGAILSNYLTQVIESVKDAGPMKIISPALSTTLGQTINNYLVHIFQGIKLREYKYSWDFIPHSSEDADTLNEIIYQLRQRSVPEYKQDAFTVDYPDFWIIESYVDQQMLFKLNYLVISDISVDYGDQNEVTFFYDGNPTITKVSITFKEVYPGGSELIEKWRNYNV